MTLVYYGPNIAPCYYVLCHIKFASEDHGFWFLVILTPIERDLLGGAQKQNRGGLVQSGQYRIGPMQSCIFVYPQEMQVLQNYRTCLDRAFKC